MKRLAGWAGLLSFVLLLGSCSSVAHIEKDDAADFSNYKTYAWLDKPAEDKKEGSVNNDLVDNAGNPIEEIDVFPDGGLQEWLLWRFQFGA